MTSAALRTSTSSPGDPALELMLMMRSCSLIASSGMLAFQSATRPSLLIEAIQGFTDARQGLASTLVNIRSKPKRPGFFRYKRCLSGLSTDSSTKLPLSLERMSRKSCDSHCLPSIFTLVHDQQDQLQT